METSPFFMSLLTELGGVGEGPCYKRVAPNGAPAASRPQQEPLVSGE